MTQFTISFLLLLLAHIVVDFYLQPTTWVIDKKANSFRSKYLYLHVLLVIVASYLFLGMWTNPLPAILLGIAHGLIDVIKISIDKKGTTFWFVADQFLHALSILFTALIITDTVPAGFQAFELWLQKPKTLALAAGMLLSLTPVSFLVGILTKPWQDELKALAPNVDDNLANAGRWIGMSERILIFVFVIQSQFSAIGFLIAAKSLLRYNDKTSPQEIPAAYITKKSEYVLVGTLMSYTCAIAIALAARYFF